MGTISHAAEQTHLDSLLNLIELGEVVLFGEGELFWSLPLADLHDEIFHFLVVEGVGVQFHHRCQGNSLVVFEGAEPIFLFDAALIVVDEHVGGVVEVDVCISPFALLAHLARFVQVPLLKDLLFEFAGNGVEMGMLFVIHLAKVHRFQEADIAWTLSFDVTEVVDFLLVDVTDPESHS